MGDGRNMATGKQECIALRKEGKGLQARKSRDWNGAGWLIGKETRLMGLVTRGDGGQLGWKKR